MDDRQLLSEYVATGSQAAFGELVSRHIDAVYAAARRQVRDPHLAEDVAQAVFIILARKAKSLGPGVIVAGWLINTAYFASMDALKSEGRRKRHEHEAAEMAPLFHAAPDTPGFSDIAPHLDVAMGKLNQKDRGAVALRFLEGKSLREVGVAMGISEEAARKRVSRAVTKLRKHLIRRGIGPASVASVAALAIVLESAANAEAAPLGLAHTVTSAATQMKMSLAGASIAKGTMTTMAWAKAKFAATAAAIVIVAGGGAVAVQQ